MGTDGKSMDGKITAGKVTAGKTAAGKTTAGKTAAGKTIAGKTTSGKTTLKMASALILVSAVSKLLGLARESTLAAVYGAGAQTDAYKIAFSIPYMLLALVTAAIATSFIPVYSGYIKNKTKEESNYFVNNVFNVTAVSSVMLAACGLLFAPWLVKLAAPGFGIATYKLAAELTLIMLPSIVFISLSGLSNAYLQSHGRFIPAAFVWIPYNVIIIGSIILFPGKRIWIVAAASFLAAGALFIMQVPFLIRTGFRFKALIDIREEGLRKMLSLALPILISISFDQVYLLIDKILASGLKPGSLSSIDYADKVNNMVYSLLVISIVTVIYPNMSLISESPIQLANMVQKNIRMVLLVSLPAAVGLYILRVPVVSLLYERGSFSSSDTHVVSTVLGCFSFGLVGIGLREVLNKVYYSIRETRIPMINGILTVCINIALDLIFIRFWGVAGLALAASTAVTASGLMLMFRLRRKVGRAGKSTTWCPLIKPMIAASLMGILIFLLNEKVFVRNPEISLMPDMFRLLVIITIGVVAYFCLLLVLKAEDLDFVRIYIGRIIYPQFKEVKSMNKYAIIMAGGTGLRFWPFSREQMPKQFLRLGSGDIMLNETIKRLTGLVDMSNVYVVAGKSHKDTALKLISADLPRRNLLFEPEPKNTSACIAYASTVISAKRKDSLLCILPSDHFISDTQSFRGLIEKAFRIAEETGKIILVGIKPDGPAAGYGYIKYGKEYSVAQVKAYKVDEFLEKPDLNAASDLSESGDYLWNSGIIVCRAAAMLNNMMRYLPRLYRSMMRLKDFLGTPGEAEFLELVYSEIPSLSIDHAILERSEDLLVIPGEFGWSDVGSWDSIAAVYKKDKYNNIIKGRHIGLETNNIVVFGSDRLIATIGIDGLIIVDTEDAMLVCSKEKTQDVKKLVEVMKNSELGEFL